MGKRLFVYTMTVVICCSFFQGCKCSNPGQQVQQNRQQVESDDSTASHGGRHRPAKKRTKKRR